MNILKRFVKKVAAGIGMMKRIKPFAPANTSQTIYQALIQPYFDYTVLPYRQFAANTSKINFRDSKIGLQEL
jgi:hypothetical protein